MCKTMTLINVSVIVEMGQQCCSACNYSSPQKPAGITRRIKKAWGAATTRTTLQHITQTTKCSCWSPGNSASLSLPPSAV